METLSFLQFVQQRFGSDCLAIVDNAQPELQRLAAAAQLDWTYSENKVALDGELLEKPDIKGVTKEDTARSAIFSTIRKRRVNGETLYYPFIRFVNHRRSVNNQSWDGLAFLESQYQAYRQSKELPVVNRFAVDEIERRQQDAIARREKIASNKRKSINRDCHLFFNVYQPVPAFFGYLMKKHLSGLQSVFDLRAGENEKGRFICYPLYSDAGVFRGLQRIYEDGTKINTYGLVKSNAFNVIGELPRKADNSYRKSIFISESMANCGTIHKATGCPAVIATDAGNIIHIARIIRAKFPNAPIVIVADNDALKPRHGNTGVTEAAKAAAEVNAWVCVPDLSMFSPDLGLTDINDVHANLGLRAVREQLRATVSEPLKAIVPHVAGTFNVLANNPKFNLHPKLNERSAA